MATNDELRGIKPFDCRGDSTSVGQDGGDGESHFIFTSMVVESQQPLEKRRCFYIAQGWKSKKSLKP